MPKFTREETEAINTRQSDESRSLGVALGVVKDNSLADQSTVEALVRDFALRRLQAFDPAHRKESIQADMADCLNMGVILTGNDPAYVPTDWNKNLLAKHVAKELDWTGDNDTETVANAFLQLLIQIYTIYNQACDGVPDESWQWQIGAAIDDTANLLLGVKPPTIDAADLKTRQDE